MNGPRTVLYLTPSVRLLGARRSLLGLVTHLDPQRYVPVVCGQSEGDLSRELKDRGIRFEVVELGWWRKGKYFLWRPFAIARLKSLIINLDADLIHCNEIYPNPYAVRARDHAVSELERRVPVVTHMRLTITARMVRNYDLHRATRIVVPSHEAGRDFDIWPDKDQYVSVIHNGVALDEYHRVHSPEEARRIIGLEGKGPLLAAIGQLGPRKGGDIIIEAFKRIAPEFPDARLMFVGDPHKGQEDFARQLRASSTAPEIAGRVHFFAFTSEILPFYEATDVNLLISREEGFGRTIIEAGAMGIPSIGARTGGIPEIIVHDQTGLLVKSENVGELADAMRRMLSDPALRERMAESVFRHIAQEFTIRSHTDKMMDLYDSLLVNAAR